MFSANDLELDIGFTKKKLARPSINWLQLDDNNFNNFIKVFFQSR